MAKKDNHGRFGIPLVLSVLVLAFLTAFITPGSAAARDHFQPPRPDIGRVDGHRYGPGTRGPWHFERDHGWRFELDAGIWSPFYVWWWLGGRVMLDLIPHVTIIHYSNGYYELRGDGFAVPYNWVWVPTVPNAPPQPPPGATPETGPGVPPPPPEPMPAAPAPPDAAHNAQAAAAGATTSAAASTVPQTPSQRTAGVIDGTLIRALMDYQIGKAADDADELRAAFALERNKTGQTSSWFNPDSQSHIAIKPTGTYTDSSGRYCRDYWTEILAPDDRKEAYGRACRQPDGRWKVQE